MPYYVKGSFTGEYLRSNPEELTQADSIIVNEFAVHQDSNEPGVVNRALAGFIAEHYLDSGLPIFMGSPVMRAMQSIDLEYRPDYAFSGTISADTTASTGGTWEELTQAKEAMSQYSPPLRQPIIIAQAYHVGRVAAQARKIGLEPLLPAGLPDMFDSESSQWWCRNRWGWMLRELIGVRVLSHRGQI